MPLEPQNIEILIGGLEQKTSDKVVKAGQLVRAVNVEFDKGGQINKRRGFRRYQFTGGSQIAALGNTMETQAIRVATYKDELLIFGVGWLWSLGSKSSSLTTKAAVRRGRVSPGNLRVVHVASGEESDE